MRNKIYFSLILLASLFATAANGEPLAYSVNADGGAQDNLYLIDLANGSDQARGQLFNGVEIRTDTEGLAFSPDGTLWGMDDASRTLFRINKITGATNYLEEISFLGLPENGANDFGMTFDCGNTLYLTSVTTRTLYRLTWEGINGNIEVVGSAGALNANISAIAAIGNPTQLYGLGNGLLPEGGEDAPNLYRIDTNTGVAEVIGALGDIGDYHEAGLAFDSNGGLWAITDRSMLDQQHSQILSIDTGSGAATVISTTQNEYGYESLAIASPARCNGYVGIDEGEDFSHIPTLNAAGRLFAILVLMLAGMGILRGRAI